MGSCLFYIRGRTSKDDRGGGGDLAIGRYAHTTSGALRPRNCRNVCHDEILMFSGSLSVMNSISLICKM